MDALQNAVEGRRCQIVARFTVMSLEVDSIHEAVRNGDVAAWGIFLKILPILFRAGALPTRTDIAYVRKIRAAGGFKRYERIHLNAITATFAPKFSHLLPPELVRRVVEYAFHVGDY